MQKPSSFHVRHDLQPTLTYELLTLFLSQPSGQTEQELRQSANTYGFRIRERKEYNKLIKSLLELEILYADQNTFSLTTQGQIISRIVLYQRDLLADFIHFLYYTNFDSDSNKRFSWSYRQVCDTLWFTAPVIISRDRLVNHVTQEATTAFDVHGVSFSTSSVSGVLNWLAELAPQCIVLRGVEQHFIRRDYCSVELFTLALDHGYRKRDRSKLSYIEIDNLFRDEICRLCLIGLDGFSDMLSLAENSFSCIDVRKERGDRISMAKFQWSDLEN